VVFMNTSDLEDRGLRAGDRVDITSHFASAERVGRGFQVVAYEIPRGCVAAYFPEANVLVPVEHVSVGSNQPASKSIPVTIVGVERREQSVEVQKV
jgi:anaerobic selenocysteine-containing dehydrogenase